MKPEWWFNLMSDGTRGAWWASAREADRAAADNARYLALSGVRRVARIRVTLKEGARGLAPAQ